MARYRSILALILAAITTLLVSCGNPPSVKAPSYSAAQIEEITRYAGGVEELRDRLIKLPTLVQQERWNDVSTFIHGPLGELRVRMKRLARTLAPDQQKQANQAADEVFEHLNAIDEAAQANDRIKALKNYNGILEDLDTFLELVPSQPS